MRLRSVIAVAPDGANLDAAVSSEADAVLLTLTHGATDVADARRLAGESLPRIRESGKRTLVVVNHPRTGLLRDDLDAIVGPELDAVLLAHATEPQDARDLAVGLREFEYTRGVEPGAIATFPVIATARGLLAAESIMNAIERNAGLVFDAPAYARDVGGRHEEQGPRFGYARGLIVAVARAFDGLPLVMTYPYQARDLAQQGFAGVIMTEAGAAPSVNDAFTPNRSAVERARGQFDAWTAAQEGGTLVIRQEGSLVDAASVRRARHVLDAAGEAYDV
jgi:citrate lyase beta subunit